MNDEANDEEEEEDEFGNRLWCEAAVPAAAEGTFSPLFLMTLLLFLLLSLISVALFLLLLLLSLLLLPREIRGGGGMKGGGTRGRAADDNAGVGGDDTNRSTCELAGLLKGLETMASWFCGCWILVVVVVLACLSFGCC